MLSKHGVIKWDLNLSRRQIYTSLYFNSVQSLSHVRLFATPWIAARQAFLSSTNSWSLLKLMSIKLVMPSNHLILCHPLLLLPSSLPSIRVFSNESVLHIRWPKYWSFSISLSNEYSGLISFRKSSSTSDIITLLSTIWSSLQYPWASLVTQMVKNLPAVEEILVQSLGREDPLATHSSILAWRILWTEEPGGLQSMGRLDMTAQVTFSLFME